MRFEVRPVRRGIRSRSRRRVYLIGDNNEVIAVGQPVYNEADALDTISTVKREAAGASVKVL